MAKKSCLLPLAFFLAGVTLFESCIKDEYDFSKTSVSNWDPEVAFPLVNSNLTIHEILNNSDKNGNITVDGDGFCTLVYRGALFSARAKDFITIPNQTFPATSKTLSASDVANFNALPAGSQYSVTNSQTVALTNLPNSNTSTPFQIENITLKGGTTFSFNMSSDFPNNAQIKIDVPDLKSPSGVAFSQIVLVNYTGSTPVNVTESFDLGGYTLTLNNGGNMNQFAVNYTITLTKASGSPVTSGNSISMQQGFNNIGFAKLNGYVGQLSIAPNADTVAISLFGNASPGVGTFSLKDPSFKAIFTNYLGVNVGASFNQLDGYTDGVSYSSDLLGTTFFTTNTPDVLIPNSPSFGTAGTSDITLTNSNTDGKIFDFINKKPKNVIYKVDAITNYGTSGYVSNFFSDTSLFKVDFDINMPLYGSAKDFELIDTTDFQLDENSLKDLKSLTLKTYMENGFPIDMYVGLVFVDSLYREIYEFIPNGTLLIQGANVDATTGKVVSKNVARNEFILDDDHINNLFNAKKVLIKAKAATSSNGGLNVKIYDFYKINVRIGLKIQPNVSEILSK